MNFYCHRKALLKKGQFAFMSLLKLTDLMQILYCERTSFANTRL